MRVITFFQSCRFNNVSLWTGQPVIPLAVSVWFMQSCCTPVLQLLSYNTCSVILKKCAGVFDWARFIEASSCSNALKTDIHLKYIYCTKPVSTPQRTHSMSVRQIYWIMLFREPIDLYCENHSEHIHGHWSQNDASIVYAEISLRRACLKPFHSSKGVP
jgi:hypothetical protein